MTADSPDISLLVVASLLLVGGIIETIFHKRTKKEQSQWIDGAAKADGVVSRITRRETFSVVSDRTVVSHTPVVLFRAPNGVQYEFEAKTEVGSVGSEVHVAFNPELPSDAREIPPESSNHYRGGCGFIMMLIALGLAVKAFF